MGISGQACSWLMLSDFDSDIPDSAWAELAALQLQLHSLARICIQFTERGEGGGERERAMTTHEIKRIQ